MEKKDNVADVLSGVVEETQHLKKRNYTKPKYRPDVEIGSKTPQRG